VWLLCARGCEACQSAPRSAATEGTPPQSSSVAPSRQLRVAWTTDDAPVPRTANLVAQFPRRKFRGVQSTFRTGGRAPTLPTLANSMLRVPGGGGTACAVAACSTARWSRSQRLPSVTYDVARMVEIRSHTRIGDRDRFAQSAGSKHPRPADPARIAPNPPRCPQGSSSAIASIHSKKRKRKEMHFCSFLVL
jgi:hypothetical protein